MTLTGILGAFLSLSIAYLFPILWRCTSDPTVQLPQGKVFGRHVMGGEMKVQLEHFLGIPFALPPLGDLRFRAPQTIPDDGSRVIKATEYGFACVQAPGLPGFSVSDLNAMSEDCLTINIIRPGLQTLPENASLPVITWIHGGGFIYGASSLYNGSELVAQSVAIGRPIIYVSLNYRLNLFGFLASPEIEESSDADLNAGLLDQRLAFQWIQRNIAAFGGDPSKVTVFGESAGAMSIGAHLLWNRGRGAEELFRGAILQSGAASGCPVSEPSDHAEAFRHFVGRVGCDSKSNLAVEAQGNILICLRNIPTQVLHQDLINIISRNRIDAFALSSLRRPFAVVQDARNGEKSRGFFYDLPSIALQNGHMAMIPIIIGANLDEGTMFAPQDLNDERRLEEHIKVGWIFPRESSKASSLTYQLLSKYPDDPSRGSPYGVESNSAPSSDDRLFHPPETNQYKRFSSIVGDYLFESGRRAQAIAASKLNVPVWGYLFEHYPLERLGSHWGVHHGAEIPYTFGVYATREDEHGDVSKYLVAAWVNFTYDLDPNGPSSPGKTQGATEENPSWPRYTADEQLLLNIRSGEKKIMKGDYRANALDWIGLDPEFNRATRR